MRLKEPEMFSSEEEKKTEGRHDISVQMHRRLLQERWTESIIHCHRNKDENIGYVFQLHKFHLNIRIKFLTIISVQQWNNLPSKIKSLQIFKKRLKRYLSKISDLTGFLFCTVLYYTGLHWTIFVVSSNSRILLFQQLPMKIPNTECERNCRISW